MKRFILVLFCILAFPVVASHIVGGEFEIIHISGNQYRINLILYFDELNGNPGAKDQQVVARIFRKRDNFVVTSVTLPLLGQEPVSYTQPECSNGEIVTSKLIYSIIMEFSDQDFSDAQGYYLAWERCCRNYTITNIFSQDPNSGGQYAGQTFYLEFPPVVKDGKPFINSTPRLFPPLNDFACPNKNYYVDFAGVDDDGDSLVYTLVTPLNTKSGDALPPGNFLPRPSPYPLVTWRPPFGLNNIIGGNPDLKISEDGFLTVTPTTLGLFVFAVRCEEFRDGVKLGEVRRDFQMLVVDGCPRAEAPKILGQRLGESEFTYDEEMTVTFSNTVEDEDRCIRVQISDPDASNVQDNFLEKVKISAIALNFKKDVKGILPDVKNATLTNGSTVEFDICFDRCPYFEGGPFQVGIVAYDDACSLPLSDTLRITVYIEPPANEAPYFNAELVTDIVPESFSQTYTVLAKDDDNDPLIIGVIPDGFTFESAGMNLNLIEQDSGIYHAQLEWKAHCDEFDFTQKSSFQITFLVEDMDDCNFPRQDKMKFNLSVDLPDNADPVISVDPPETANGVTRKVFDKLEFNVIGEDRMDPTDLLVLSGKGYGFNMSNHNITFTPVIGTDSIGSHFIWDLKCDKLDLEDKNSFDLVFMVVDDQNKCGFYQADTLTVKVDIEPPDNEKPLLTVLNTNPELTFINHEQSLLVGQQISLALISNDGDLLPEKDRIRIELVDASGNIQPSGYVFSDADGMGSAQTTFTWDTDCTIFEDPVYENNYTFRFRTWDDRCFNAKADTVDVNITIKDVQGGDTEFVPPNIITPNGDGCNDFFAMEGMEELLNSCGEFIPVNLPQDNCIGRFATVFIYNRWGTKVYESSQRNFRWYPVDEAAGVYFYTLKYSHKEYKGTITLRN